MYREFISIKYIPINIYIYGIRYIIFKNISKDRILIIINKKLLIVFFFFVVFLFYFLILILIYDD